MRTYDGTNAGMRSLQFPSGLGSSWCSVNPIDAHCRIGGSRAAFLFKEGGFYTDLDVEPSVPFAQMVDKDTGFVSPARALLEDTSVTLHLAPSAGRASACWTCTEYVTQ